MSTIYVAAFQPDGLSFLLFVACLPMAVGIATIGFLNQVPYVEASEIEDHQQYLTTGACPPPAMTRLCKDSLQNPTDSSQQSVRSYIAQARSSTACRDLRFFILFVSGLRTLGPGGWLMRRALCCAGKRFGVLYAAVGLIVIYQLISAVVQQVHGLTHGQSIGVMIGVLVLLSTVLLAPFGSGGVISRPAHQQSSCTEGRSQEHCGSRCA